MNDSQVQRLSTTPNAVVVQLPERKHPGIVIQGDSLNNLRRLCEDVQKSIEAGEVTEGLDTLGELQQILSGYVASYQQAINTADGRK